MAHEVLGVDIGGSSIKHGWVDARSGQLVGELGSVPTPRPATPQALIQAIAGLARTTMPATEAVSTTAIGVALPSVIRGGRIYTAVHLDPSLVGFAIASALGEATGRKVVCCNDADAAGLAEVHCGAARGQGGVVMVLTFGTGIGSALFVDGRLVPNAELGHLPLRGTSAERWASARVRTAENLDWPAWAARVNEYLALVHGLFWPELFVIGGGVSQQFSQFGPLLCAPCPVVAAHFGPAAGVVGAALAAAREAT